MKYDEKKLIFECSDRLIDMLVNERNISTEFIFQSFYARIYGDGEILTISDVSTQISPIFEMIKQIGIFVHLGNR